MILKEADIREGLIKLLLTKGMYKLFISSLLFLICSINLLSQIDSISLKYEHLLNKEEIRSKLKVLANDSLLGRETARIGQVKAQSFIVSEFKKVGITPGNNGSYLQIFKVIESNFDSISFSFDQTSISAPSQIFSANSPSDTIIKSKAIVFAGYGISNGEYNDYKNISVEDKIVFIIDGTPKDNSGEAVLSESENRKWYRDKNLKVDLAASLGAKAIVFIMDDIAAYFNRYKNYMEYRNLSLYDEVYEDKIMLLFMDNKVFYSLFETSKSEIEHQIFKSIKGKRYRKLEKKGIAQIEIKTNREIKTSTNIMAKVESLNLDAPWIIISAHYDHVGFDSLDVYNGADDNGSGTAAVMELSRIFNRAINDGVNFEKNILFLLVSGEEKGLLGSKYFVSNPVYEFDKTITNLNIDMIGRVDKKHIDDENYVYIIGADRISKQLHEINNEMNDLYTDLDLDYTYNEEGDPNRYYYRSDHYNFAKQGVPIIFYYNGTHEDYHKKSDTEDKINYDILLKRTQLVFHTAWYIARMKENLRIDLVE